ncbi:MAG: right-handed parallel beta-helix repeat-containing protein [Candidatus Bathyarchaeota archaeon]|jgi:parallel beta-helix repeat protein|nr:MAG: right-handed parallel beta-helix repeat-containing protein [Candidatus Bathyarchaeota archaeon]
MKGRTALALLSLLIFVSMTRLTTTHVNAATVWIVNSNNIGGFSRIQDAIEAASEGDTVRVMAGTYYEHVVVQKSVSLIGENSSTTIINGSGEGTAVSVNASNIVVQGFTLANSGNGVYVTKAFNCTVQSNNVRNNKDRGIIISMSQNCTVLDNYVEGTWQGYGLNVNASERVLVKDNAAINNYFDGIGFFSSTSSEVVGNTVSENRLFGMVVDYQSDKNLIYSNNFFSNGKQVASSNPTNSWNHESHGNYWEDYAGTDSDGDGIGDAPFTVDEESQQEDAYPLIRPYVNEIYLRVDTKPPIAAFTFSPSPLFENETLNLDASSTSDSVGKNAIVSYDWNFGDGTLGSGLTVDHRYENPGNFTVILTVTDVAGNENVTSMDVHVVARDSGEAPFLVTGAVVTAILVVSAAIAVWGWQRKRKV